jgi:hypothetical protein
LSVWLLAFGIVAALVAAAASVFMFLATPVATPSDAEFYEAQIDRLDRQARSYRENGEDPISVVFIGTSRMKNVAFDSAQVTRAASLAGVERPIANIFMAINWGGFERFGPAVELLRERRPDVVVLMPELFVEDFNYVSRAQLGYRYLQTKLWGQDYKLFGIREFSEPVCHGFERTVEDRLADHREWIRDGSGLRGPAAARQAVRDLADRGVLVVVADVPVSRTMTALRPPASGRRFAAESNLPLSRQVRTAWIGQPLADGAYCDWAHIHPSRADVWRQRFFSTIAGDLNRLRT